jgi:hypothetical protein
MDGHCHEAAQTHCSKNADGTPSNKFIGMEKVSDKEVCVDAQACPIGSYADPMTGRC